MAAAQPAFGQIKPTLEIERQAPPEGVPLQLEVFVNGMSTGLIAAIYRRPDGSFTSAASELDAVGLKTRPGTALDRQVPFADLPGVTVRYDESTQSFHVTAPVTVLKSTVIQGAALQGQPPATRPPLGAVVNYTLFASADDGPRGVQVDGLAAGFETRVFGRFGLVENGFATRFGGSTGTTALRLDSTWTYDDPGGLKRYVVGDLIAGGLSWTRPIRLGGVQLRRNFGLQPDLVTLPLPTLAGTARTPSTLDLYINGVQSLSTQVPAGPYEISNPPVIYGGGMAQIVTTDVLGRQTVLSAPFYASPRLLARGLSDFSAELGFPRRNYAFRSNDYDSRLAASMSYRAGLTDKLTIEAHAEGTEGMLMLGGGAVFTVADSGVMSIGASASQAGGDRGALIDATFETQQPRFSLIVRTQRAFGRYNDLASWTAVVPRRAEPGYNPEVIRALYEPPRALTQATVSLPLRWRGAAAGASYVDVRRRTSRTRIVNLSFTKEFRGASFFVSALADLDQKDSRSIYVGLSVPLGRSLTAGGGVRESRGKLSGYAELHRQGADRPGSIDWSLRASAGETQELDAAVRYTAAFAQFEGRVYRVEDHWSATAQMEGALTWISGGLHATERLNGAFAIVEVGAAGVPVLRENRLVGVTRADGTLLTPELAPFVANRISIDPTALPIDARVSVTEAVVAPFARVAARVSMPVNTSVDAALIGFVDEAGAPLPLGSQGAVPATGATFVVGYDGQGYLEGLAERNVTAITKPDGGVCEARFPYRPRPGAQARIDGVICRETAR